MQTFTRTHKATGQPETRNHGQNSHRTQRHCQFQHLPGNNEKFKKKKSYDEKRRHRSVSPLFEAEEGISEVYVIRRVGKRGKHVCFSAVRHSDFDDREPQGMVRYNNQGSTHTGTDFGSFYQLRPFQKKKKKKEHLNYYTIKSRGISVAKCK